jgi:hypothetical protein
LAEVVLGHATYRRGDRTPLGKCPDRAKGLDWHRCNCRKSILVYDGKTRTKDGKLTNRIVSAKTRSWSQAETLCQEWLDQFDPEKQELKRLDSEHKHRWLEGVGHHKYIR